MNKLLLLLLPLLLLTQCTKESSEDDTPIVEEEEPTSLAIGLELHYPLDGTGKEITSADCDGLVSGTSIVNDRNDKATGALYFDTGDYIKACNYTDAGFGGRTEYTLSAWVKLETNDQGGIICSKFDGGVRAGWYLRINDEGQVMSYRNASPWAYASEVSIPKNEFVFVAATYDGQFLNLFINGEVVLSEVFGSHPNDVITPIIIGGVHSQGEIVGGFEGTIDDIRIYDRVLLEEEMQWLATH